MDRLQRIFHQKSFKIAFLESKGAEIEKLFPRIMGRAFPGDFQPVRTQENRGDLKCDGHRESDKTEFQRHGPESTNSAKWLKKFGDDFNHKKLGGTGRSAVGTSPEFGKKVGVVDVNIPREDAPFAILSYFFERREIFEYHSGGEGGT